MLLRCEWASADARFRAETVVPVALMPAAPVAWPHWWGEGPAPALVSACAYCGRGAARLANEDAPPPRLTDLLTALAERIRESTKPIVAEIVLSRLGLVGEEIPTLESFAERLALTRERIRQMEASIEKRPRRQLILPAVLELGTQLQALYAPYMAVSESVAAMILRVEAVVSEKAAYRILHLLSEWDADSDKWETPHVFKQPDPASDASTAELSELVNAARMILDSHAGEMPPEALVDAVWGDEGCLRFPDVLLNRIADILETLEFAEVSNGFVSASVGRMASAGRLRRIIAILMEAGEPLHVTRITERYNSLPGVEAPRRPQAIGGFLVRYPDEFVLCGPGTWGLREWGVGASLSREELRAAGIASTRRAGAGDEVAALLYREGRALPLAAIEQHVLARFNINATSVLASMVQDMAQRFVQDENGDWALRRRQLEGDGMMNREIVFAPPIAVRPEDRRLERVLVSGEDLERAAAKALELLATIDEKLRTGLPGVSNEMRFQWAILKAAIGDGESTMRLLRGLDYDDRPEFPPSAVQAVIDL